MGKTKEFLLGDIHLSQEEMEHRLYVRGDEDYLYKQWLKSPEYVEFVNEQITRCTPKYSEEMVDRAIQKSFEALQILPDEVGKDTYAKLFRQHFFENLV